MKIVADDNIPAVANYFGGAGELILKPGRDINRQDLLTADILLVRAVTRVDGDLLHDTNIKFVASAATGIDHLDTQWLDQAGIAWYAARGCNAVAVEEYVVAVIVALQKLAYLPQKKLRAGVIGVGAIGGLVVDKLTMLGFEVIQCDPLRAQQDSSFPSVDLTQFQHLDLITIHTPLTRHGQYPTFHLLDRDFLLRQQKNCVLINTARGAVIDFLALKEYGDPLYCCLDVWENEPVIDFDVLAQATIATPHIAGYSVQSKLRGIEMAYQAAVAKKIIPAIASLLKMEKLTLDFAGADVNWRDVVLKVFDPRVETERMKNALIANDSDKTFDDLRKNFNKRYEFGFVEVRNAKLSDEDQKILSALGFLF
jgi:erythronate-4-phosphate dehydrogenase